MAETFNIGDDVILNYPGYKRYHGVIGTVLERSEWEDDEEWFNEETEEYETEPRLVVEYRITFHDPLPYEGSFVGTPPQTEGWFDDSVLSYHNVLAKITEPSEDIYNDLI